MANIQNSINLIGVGTSVQMSTLPNCTLPLTAGQYAVWTIGQVGYITQAVGSSLFTAAVGFPVQAPQTTALSGASPLILNVGVNGQIGCISTSSGTLVYQQVG